MPPPNAAALLPLTVQVVSVADYQTYLKSLQDKGRETAKPLLGGSDAYTQAGLNTDTEGVNK